MNGKAGKVQIPRAISYCALATIGVLVVLGIVAAQVPAQLRVVVLILPLPLGVFFGMVLYFQIGHEAVQYDEYGFTITKGRRTSKSYKWEQFTAVSLFLDSRGGVNVRMYYQPDGEYVDLPATRTGIDPFSLRNNLQRMFARV